MSRLRLVLAAAALLGVLPLLSPPAHAAFGPCRSIGDHGPQNARPTSAPPPAPVLFPSDFRPPVDCEWGFRVGGWGGVRRGAPITHDPVIFVHGNHSDAVDWFGVADQFKAAGYNDQELWAISYNGLGGQIDGAPIVCACPPSQRAVAYMSRPDVAPYVLQGGPYAANDVNVPDLYLFVKAVLAYTGAGHVQLVGHSLGVTVIRKMLFVHRELFAHVSAVVSIAGGNHGTSLCRGMETTLYSCDEVAPDSPWLKQLNSIGETPGPTKYMSIYNGSNNLDPFFLQTPMYDDRQAPRMQGAINLTYADAYHSDLRVRPDIVATYQAFLAKSSRQGR
jgi:pimeloyl-ACP methyl ester carboxylesterase